jgi:hypothetical protein
MYWCKADAVHLIVLQSEDSSAEDWVAVPDTDIASSVKCFFDISTLGEFTMKGFSLDYWSQLGGNGVTYVLRNL